MCDTTLGDMTGSERTFVGTHLYLTAIRVPTKVLSLPVISPRVVSHII